MISIKGKLNIRKIQETNRNFIYNVKKITLKSYIEQIWGKWDDEYQRKRFNDNFVLEEFHIIQYEGKDIGILSSKEKGTRIDVYNIEILPKYQNRGIGTEILKKILNKAKLNKLNVYLQVYNINKDAIRFYKRLGFIKYLETETHYKLKYITSN